jgi:hypothetical protein
MRAIDLAANEAPAVISATNKTTSSATGGSIGTSAKHAIRPHEVSACDACACVTMLTLMFVFAV